MKKTILLSTLLVLFWFGWISSATTTITHYTGNISYTLNGNETYTWVWTITITDEVTTITMLDRNLWATKAWTGCKRESCSFDDMQWYHFQWWNNYGFDSNNANITNLQNSQVSGHLVSSWYINWFFHYWYWFSNWIDDDDKIDMRWWSISDNTFNVNEETWKVTNALERQWPCPEWFHVPSYWEWQKVLAMVNSNYDSVHNDLLIPLWWFRSSRDHYLTNLGTWAYVWTSSPSFYSGPGSRSLQLTGWYNSAVILANRGSGRSVRCFYNEYESYPIEKTKITSIDISGVTNPILWQHAVTSWLTVTTNPANSIDLWAASWTTVWEPFTWWADRTGIQCHVGDAGCTTFSATQNWNKYYLRLIFTPKDWYEMADNYTVTTNWVGEIETWYDTVYGFKTIKINYSPSEIPPSTIENIIITWITAPIVWETPTTGWIASLTEWLTVVDSNIYRNYYSEPNFWTFMLWEKYQIYIPFTLSDWYEISPNCSVTFNWQKGIITESLQRIEFKFVATAAIDPNTTVTHYPSEYVDVRYTLNDFEYSAGVITVKNWTDAITILDRNLWATAAGTGCKWQWMNCLDDQTYWYHFQWWNNYWFSINWTIITNPTQVDASDYWPGTNNGYYSGSTFINVSTGWDSSDNWNLRWWTTSDDNFNLDDGTWKVTNASERQWPCPQGFHVPSYWELKKISNILWDNQTEIHNKLLIPLAGYRDKSNASVDHDDFSKYANLWSSSPSSSSNRSLGVSLSEYNVDRMERSDDIRSQWFSVRCFYDKYEIYCPNYQHTEDNMTCTGNSKQVECDSSLEIPVNATYDIKNVTVTWDKENNRRNSPEKCSFTCNDGYFWSDCNTKIIHKNSNISYKLNEDKDFVAGTVTITDWTDTITMLDRNLWATAAGTGCEDWHWWRDESTLCSSDNTYWYHFQWWNNYAFNPTDKSITDNSVDVNTSWAARSDDYRSTFIKSDTGHWFDYWEDSIENSPNHENLWWWSGDYNDINWWYWLNNENRRWPCPEGFHVPSIWEWNKLLSMITWTNNEKLSVLHNDLLIPFAGWWDATNATPQDLGNVAGLWSSSSNSATDHFIIGLNLIINDYADYTYGPHWYGASVRCFYDKYEEYPDEHKQSGWYSWWGWIAKTDTTDEDSSAESENDIQDNSDEFQQAYKFAYKNWITTMDTIDKADMEGPLTRIAMAKMLSNYAINILGKKPANVVVPNFPDITAELDEEYNFWVTLAYQLWIMGINIDKFRPFDDVTRAEFVTALSRMLFSTPDGDPYYVTHIKKLKEEWIITNDNPDMQELRWYVMIMLMRSAKN